MRRTTRASNGVQPVLLVCRGSAARLAVYGLAGAILFGSGFVFAQPEPAGGGNAAAVPEPPAPGGGADPLARAQMAIDKPLMTLEEDEALRRKLSLKIRKILREGVLNDENREAINEWVDWRLFRMTITEVPPTPPAGNIGNPPPKPRPYRDQLADFNKRFLQEIHGAGRFQENNPVARENFRRYVLDRIIE